ncbi:MAG: oligosaccharide flippase family protein [Bacteroidia bacterium]|nr:oligosaccharide flippase family protein [Bacteroidia bacterium]
MFSLKNILKASSVYTILGFLPTASRIFLLPVFLLYLSPEQFALVGLNTVISSILPLFMTLGLESSFSRFYYDYKRKPKLLSSYLSTLIIFILINSIIISALFICFGNIIFDYLFKSEEFSFYPFGLLATISAIISALSSVFINYLRNKQDLKNFTYFSLSTFLLSTIAETVVIVIFHYDAKGVIFAKLIATGAIAIFFLLKFFIKNGIFFDFRFIKSSIKYALPLIPYSAFGLIFIYYDRILIENKLDLTSLAVYNLAMSIAHITDAFMFAIQSATYPIVYEMLKANVKQNMNEVNKTYRLIGVIVLFIMTGIIAVCPFAIINFLKSDYISAIKIIPIILISYAYRYLYIVYAEPLFFFKKTNYLPFLTLISGVINLGSNIVLIPLFGISGASIATVLGKIFQFLPTYYFYKTMKLIKFNLSYITSMIVVVMIISIALFLGFDILIQEKLLLYLASICPLIFVCLFIYFRFLRVSNFKNFVPNIKLLKEIF